MDKDRVKGKLMMPSSVKRQVGEELSPGRRGVPTDQRQSGERFPQR